MDTNKFVNRHVGISAEDIPAMLETIGVKSLDELIDQTIPANIRLKEPLNLPEAMTEREFAEHIAELASKNEVFTSYIGMGWYDTVCPAPIQRNVFENPVWYTSYTPYQAEVSQGRLEALLNFQTVICELTGLPLANCSLLDEATAAAEAVTMFHGSRSRAQVKAEANTVFVDENVFASTLAVIHTRIVPGDGLTLRLAPKGAGSENKSVVKMLVPADGIEGVRKVVLDAVLAAGPNSCPPMVVGVGLGGTMEVAALCAKRAAARDLESRNPDPRYAAFEDELLELINRTGIGPQGLGGETTALKVHVEWAPTHIASLPVAVNINCHAARHAEVRL